MKQSKALDKSTRKKIEEFYLEEAEWIDEVVHTLYPRSSTFIEYRLTGRLANVASWLLINFAGFKIIRNQEVAAHDPRKMRGSMFIKNINVTVTRRGKEVAKRAFPIGVIIKSNK